MTGTFTPTAIETEYAGHLFRSRLEARWAVFFDQLGINWRYEAQGYEFDGYRYLPDFHLPDDQCFVEVKGDADKLVDDGPRLEAFAKAVGPLIVLGDVSTPTARTTHRLPSHFMYCDQQNQMAIVAVRARTEGGGRYGMLPVAVSHEPFVSPRYIYGIQPNPRITAAYRTARTARFEFGETPQPPGPAK